MRSLETRPDSLPSADPSADLQSACMAQRLAFAEAFPGMFLAVSQTLGSWLPLYPTFTHMICELSPSYRKGGREMNGDLAAYSFGRVSDICVMLLSSPHRYNLLLLT